MSTQDFMNFCEHVAVSGNCSTCYLAAQKDNQESLYRDYIALLNSHLDECPIDGSVCTSCFFVRKMLAKAEKEIMES